jgi:hypothetical protein
MTSFSAWYFANHLLVSRPEAGVQLRSYVYQLASPSIVYIQRAHIGAAP